MGNSRAFHYASAFATYALLAATPAFSQTPPPGYVLDDPWAEFKPVPERLGPGPHTLVVSDRQGMTKMDYATGPKCQRARDAVRKQTAPPPNTASVIHGPSSVKAFCVPR